MEKPSIRFILLSNGERAALYADGKKLYEGLRTDAQQAIESLQSEQNLQVEERETGEAEFPDEIEIEPS